MPPPGGRGAATRCCASGIRFPLEIPDELRHRHHSRALHGADALSPRRSARCCSSAPKDGLAGAWFEAQKHHPAPIDAPVRDDDPLLQRAAAQLAAYFDGAATRFDLPLDLIGTPFQLGVWRELLAIEPGRTCSYGDIARKLGNPTAGRAVGAAVGRNPVSVIVPCHRVARQRRRPHRLCRRPRAQDRPAPARGRARAEAAAGAGADGDALRPRDVAELIALAAIWGASFLFMRIAVPEFGPVAIAALRVAGASLLLVPLLAARGDLGMLRRHWRPIAVLGLTNSALPFLGFAYAAISIDSGVLAIFNSAAPLFAAVVAWLWLGDRMTPARIAGLAIGFAGVVWIIVYKAGLHAGGTPLAILACLVATRLLRRLAERHQAPSLGRAAARRRHRQPARRRGRCSPSRRLLAWPATPPTLSAWLVVAALSFVCTGLALLMYFRLIAHAGPANAISVTYLIPIFAIAWGSLFLDEAITWPLLAGCAVVFLGTALATGILPTAPHRCADTLTIVTSTMPTHRHRRRTAAAACRSSRGRGS